MSVNYNPGIITSGLTVLIDAANPRSYSGTGSTVFDLSGNNNHGTISGTITYNNKLFTFGGGYISVPNSTTLASISGNCSLSIWLYPTTLDGTYRRFISFGSFPNQTFWIECDGATPGNILMPDFSAGSIAINNWYNLVATFDGTNSYFYRNGSLILSGAKSSIGTTTSGVGIGADANGGGGSFLGNIAMAQIYNICLSATQVAQNFNAARGRYGI